MKSHRDYTEFDQEAIGASEQPVRAFKPAGAVEEYGLRYTRWGEHGEMSARDYYRVAWRCMAANAGSRTLQPAIIPPGAAHVDGLYAAAMPNMPNVELVVIAGVLGSLLSDFSIRAAPKSTIRTASIGRLAMVPFDHPLINGLILRTLRLNCVTDAYADLWEDCWDAGFRNDAPILQTFVPVEIGPLWSPNIALRRSVERRNALVELDALIALMLNVPIDDLCTVYRTQFAVLYGYDHREYTFDANGRQVPTPVLQAWRKAGGAGMTGDQQRSMPLTHDDLTATHPGSGIDYTYRLPFGTLDREADMRTSYAEWQRRLTVASHG